MKTWCFAGAKIEQNRTKNGPLEVPEQPKVLKNVVEIIKRRKKGVCFPGVKRFYRFLSDLGVHFGGHFRDKI